MAALTREAAAPAIATCLFRKEGEYWTIAYEGELIRVRDSKGLGYIAHLLRYPAQAHAASAILAAANSRQELTVCGNGGGVTEAERSRLAVTKRIKAALQKLWLLHPALGHHLSVSITTGSQCVYTPNPVRPVLWEF